MSLTPSSIEIRDIFISHRGVDNEWANDLAEWLELNSIKVWIDDLDINPGQSVVGAINHGLKISRHVALVMTPAYFDESAEWPTAEWEAALFTDPTGRRSRVIPLHVENCPSIPPLLSHLSWIDFRDSNNLRSARDTLLRTLQGRPSRYATRAAGQIITPSGDISRTTLFAERSSVLGRPDEVAENLASNLLPAIKVPEFVWSVPISKTLSRETPGGITYPQKRRLKTIIRTWQEENKHKRQFTPAFIRYGDSLWTLHDPNSPSFPLTPIAESDGSLPMRITDLLSNDDQRKRVIALFGMAINRYCYHLKLEQDEKERYFFPSKNRASVVKRWKLKKSVPRTVTSRYETKDGTTFFHHDAVNVEPFFLGEKLFLRVDPAIAFSDDGTPDTVWFGAHVGVMAMKWRAREKNIDVFRDLRFWIYQLAKGQSTIVIFAGDQEIRFDTLPASIHLRRGIGGDQSNVEELMERVPDSPSKIDLEAIDYEESDDNA